MATRAEWTKRVQQWDKSGQGIEEFAAREGLKPELLTWWRWKLRTEQPAPKTEAPLSFLPVHVIDTPTQPEPCRAPIEIVFPNGRVVRVSPGFDRCTLERVVTIVAEVGASC
jgi:transposase